MNLTDSQVQLESKRGSRPHGQAAPLQKPVRLEDGQGPFPRFPLKVTATSSANSLTSSFPSWVHLNAFSLLVALAGASGTLLTRNGKNRYPYLVPDFIGKALSFSMKYVVSCGILIDALYQIEEVSLYS